MVLDEALEILARQGNEQAAALLAYSNRPKARLRDFLLDKAVEADPYWSKTENGDYHVRAGATYQSPDELVDAYLESHGDRLLEDLPPDLLEYLGGQELADQIGEELERRVAAGELERSIGEDGKPVYRPVGGG